VWRHRVGIAECFGLSPIAERLREATITFRGDPSTPRSRFDHTSLALLRPSLSLPLWLGRQPGGRRAPIYNFSCHDQPQVQVGERVERGQRLGLSGASGIDGFLLFPWSTPHLHFNCWLDGAYVDPFARPGEIPLWASGENHPRPCRVRSPEEAWSPTTWNDDAIERALRACLHPGARRDIELATTTGTRGMNAHFHLSYFPTRFSERPALVHGNHPRAPRLDLPLPADEYEGALF